MKPNDDRETLSALFDDELVGEARLFALRRLSHDAAWKDECGRWQVIGDAMRRQSTLAAPADFATRVMQAVAAESPAAAATPALSSRARRGRWAWAGGALAASLALVTVLAVRAPRVVPAAPVAATAVQAAPTADAPVSATANQASTAPALAAADDAAPAAPRAMTPATAEPRAPGVRRARRTTLTAVEAPSVAVAATAVPASPLADANPFHVPAADPLSARPWPRAALPGGAGAFTASYGNGLEPRDGAPSFYPFEPKPQAAPRADPTP